MNEHVQGLAATMVGKSRAEADARFTDAMEKLSTASEAYDAETDHGKQRGTIIDTSVE